MPKVHNCVVWLNMTMRNRKWMDCILWEFLKAIILKMEAPKAAWDLQFALFWSAAVKTHPTSIQRCVEQQPNRIIECHWHCFQDPKLGLQSSTYFKKLELSGTFSPRTRIYPELWFHTGVLSPDLPKVLPDGRFILNLSNKEAEENLPLVTMTLYGRNYHLDGPIPTQFCPHDPTVIPDTEFKNEL